jgi:hypothetical protein
MRRESKLTPIYSDHTAIYTSRLRAIQVGERSTRMSRPGLRIYKMPWSDYNIKLTRWTVCRVHRPLEAICNMVISVSVTGHRRTFLEEISPFFSSSLAGMILSFIRNLTRLTIRYSLCYRPHRLGEFFSLSGGRFGS